MPQDHFPKAPVPKTLKTFTMTIGGSYLGMGQILAGASWSRYVKNSMDGEGLNGWSKAQRVFKGSTGDQGLNRVNPFSGNEED